MMNRDQRDWRLLLGLALIGISLIPYGLRWFPIGPFFCLPIFVSGAILIRLPLVHLSWIATFSVLSFSAVAFTQRAWQDAAADVFFFALAIGLMNWLRYQRPKMEARNRDWERVKERLKRQSEQLRFSDSQLMDAIRTQQDTQQAYLKSEAERQSLLEHLPVYVIQKDREGKFTFATQSFCRLVNKELHEVLGQSDFDLFPPATAEKFRNDDLEVMRNGTVFNDVEKTQLPHGQAGYMQVRKAPLRNADGQIVGVQVIFWDVTEEFTSRIELSKIESLTHALINAALDGVLIVDSQARILKANPACERILGYTAEQFQAHPVLSSIMQATSDENAEQARLDTNEPATAQYALNRLLSAAKEKRIEVLLKRNDGCWFDAEISAHPLEVDSSSGWAIFVRDITRRKQAEKELRKAKENAEQASIAKSEFVANVSHELRTPLTGIIGLHELLQNTEMDSQQSEYLELARLSATNLLTLIDDLLDFSKIEAHQLELEIASFSPVECIEKAAISVAARAQLRGLDLLLDLDPKLPVTMSGDSQRIQQVLLNIIGNAIKFTERGSIRIRATLQHNLEIPNSRLQDVSSRADWIRIEVIDTGIGIEPHQLDFIFEPFRQADSSTTRRYGGTGLGLAICRELVTLMHGRIHVASTAGKGSTFAFELPIQGEFSPPTIAVEASPALPERRPPQTVALVLQDGPLRDILQRDIESYGFQVRRLSVADLIARQPAELFAAGNQTMIVTDYRDLMNQELRHPPVVVKWIFLIPLSHSRPRLLHNWLTYSDVQWLAIPWRRSELADSLRVSNAASEAARPPALPSKTPAATKSASVLLVEDSPISQTVLTEMLRKLGHRVEAVGTGKDAVAKCATQRYDLVLMDIQMPETDGLEATQLIRAAERSSGRHQIIIALTAHAMPSDRVRCQEVGMDGFLVKPIAFELLQLAVDTVLGLSTTGAQAILFNADRQATNQTPSLHSNGSPPGSATRSGSPPTQSTEQDSPNAGLEVNVPYPAASPIAAETPSTTDLVTAGENSAILLSVAELEAVMSQAPELPALTALFSGNTNLMREVLNLLVRELPRLRKLFETSLENKNCAEVRRAVHTLKSNVRYVGLNAIADYAEQLEKLARENQLDALQDQAQMVSHVFDYVANWADTVLRKR